MALEAYAPTQMTLAGEALHDAKIVTLYDADGDAPQGSLTGVALDAGQTAGPLAWIGLREGRRWQVVLTEIEVTARSAVGCEFRITGGVERTSLEPADMPTGGS